MRPETKGGDSAKFCLPDMIASGDIAYVFHLNVQWYGAGTALPLMTVQDDDVLGTLLGMLRHFDFEVVTLILLYKRSHQCLEYSKHRTDILPFSPST